MVGELEEARSKQSDKSDESSSPETQFEGGALYRLCGFFIFTNPSGMVALLTWKPSRAVCKIRNQRKRNDKSNVTSRYQKQGKVGRIMTYVNVLLDDRDNTVAVEFLVDGSDVHHIRCSMLCIISEFCRSTLPY